MSINRLYINVFFLVFIILVSSIKFKIKETFKIENNLTIVTGYFKINRTD